MNIIWRRAAEADLDGVFDYILQYDPGSALRLYDIIRKAVERLAIQPLGEPEE